MNSGFSLHELNMNGSDLLGIAQNYTSGQEQTKNNNFICLKTRNSMTEKCCTMTQDHL